MIDAEVRSEERFSRLSLAYESEDEKQKVTKCLNGVIEKHNMKPEMYTTKVSNGKEVLVVEYHDDVCREAGGIFEDILCSLDIKECN
ncbi:hypothetical protein [Sulfurimonas marina]|uniref:Uncharacterized protein n=1 Tax=Sulfurimonas marina TaxID=2590551 RepID=A0A7M1AWC8_9BACT|nr:hypothetical protein [Sulfurimonas marina]QOP41616.1 hypothetical protein FJR03_07580 [Sulfurimonas marina]